MTPYVKVIVKDGVKVHKSLSKKAKKEHYTRVKNKLAEGTSYQEVSFKRAAEIFLRIFKSQNE